MYHPEDPDYTKVSLGKRLSTIALAKVERKSPRINFCNSPNSSYPDHDSSYGAMLVVARDDTAVMTLKEKNYERK